MKQPKQKKRVHFAGFHLTACGRAIASVKGRTTKDKRLITCVACRQILRLTPERWLALR